MHDLRIAIRQATQSFPAVATFGSPGAIWEHDPSAEEVSALRVTPNLAEVLGIQPVLGSMRRTLDSRTGDPNRVVFIFHSSY